MAVDLTAVSALDSGAVHAMLAHADHLQPSRNPLLIRALTLSGLADVVEIFDTN